MNPAVLIIVGLILLWFFITGRAQKLVAAVIG
jgi:hypothetical protein